MAKKSIPIGICASPAQVSALADDYDYLEPALSSELVPLEDEAAFQPRQEALAHSPLPARAFNLFVPGDVKLVGPEADWDQIERYVAQATARARTVGARVIVFGSGGARRVPKGYARAKAWGQLVRFLNLCADYAEQGPTIAIEPLNTAETNVINTFEEAVQLARDVDRAPIRALVDIYHLMAESEPLANVRKHARWLAHVHLADSGRLYPGSGSYPLRRLMELLHEVEYQGMASVECRWGEDFVGEAKAAAAFLHKLA